jgi:hypothetical protein
MTMDDQRLDMVKEMQAKAIVAKASGRKQTQEQAVNFEMTKETRKVTS